MANLVDSSVNGDLRVTGTMFGTQAGNYATCATAAGTAAKAVTISGFTLTTGIHVYVKFTVTNTAAVASLTLNVSGTGAKAMKYRGGNLPAVGTLSASRVYEFIYDGTNWELVGDLDTNTQTVTGVKGNSESSYRTGQVNITPANIGVSATTTSVTVGDTTASIPQATTTTPKMDGTAAVGSDTKWAKGDHVHPTDTSRVPTTRKVNGHALSADVTVTAADVSAVRYDTNAQGLTDTQKSNARTNIGAGTSNLTLGTTSTTAAKGDHTHTTSIAEDTGTATVTLAHNKTYKLTSGGTSVIFKTPTDSDANTIPSAYCETAAGTAAKTASCTNYTATPDTYLHVLIRYANTSAGALTLNVNGQGAKPIYINGAVSSSSNYTLPAGTYIAYYDGTNYWLRTDGKLQAAITGTAGFADAVYNRSNQTGDGWFKLAETKLQPRANSDNTAIWDVALAVAGGGIAYEKICLDVRFNSSGDGVVSRFVRTYEADWTGSVKFAVLVSGQGGSGNTQVQLWAWQNQAWRGISIRQAAGSNWSLSKYNNSGWTYYSADTGGTSKPVADATNHISVTDSTNVHMRAASFISTGTLPVARGGTGAGTAAGAQYNLIDKATTDLGTMGDAVRIAIMTTAPSATQSVFAGYRTGSSLWTYMKGKMSSDTGVNISGNAATASAAQSGSALETSINGKVSKSGDTMTGQLVNTMTGEAIKVSHGTGNKDAFVSAERTDQSVKVSFGVGAGGVNHGLYSNKNSNWIVKADTSGNVTVNDGKAGTTIYLGNTNVGATNKPMYLASGKISEGSLYAGGTAVTLNNSSKAGSTASFYAPTAGGTANYVLIGNGTTSAPTWAEKAPKAVVTDYLNMLHTNEVNFKNVPTSGNKERVWFNYRNGDTDAGDANNLITQYYFGNRNLSTGGVTLIADNFSGNASTATTSTNSNNTKVTTANTTKTYLAGANATGYTSGAQASLLADTGVYLTTTAGQLHATTFDVNSKCTLQFNTTTNALDFVFA